MVLSEDIIKPLDILSIIKKFGDNMDLLKKIITYTGIFALGIVCYKSCIDKENNIVNNETRTQIEETTEDISERVDDIYQVLTR